jgi:NTE family protein
VHTDIVPEGEETHLIIKVKEKASVRMRLGGKLDKERRAQSYIEFGDDNFLGGGLKTALVTRLGLRDGLLSLNLRNDRIFTTYLTFSLRGYYSWQINHIAGWGQSGRYRESRYGVRFQIGQQLRRIGQLAAELRIERAKDETHSGIFNLEQDLELRTFSLHSITDKRDRIDFPSSGIYNRWIWESGSQFFLNSQQSFTKAALNLEVYYTLQKNHTWHLRLMTGVGDETLPFSETYRLGGLHNFFGLHEDQLFGRQIMMFNVEYRLKLPFDIMDGFYIGGRFDFGGVWEKPKLLFDADDFFTGMGAYLAFDTLLGPLYMAYGQLSEGRSMTYLSLGFNF